jgi:hypothetical protein
LRFSLFFSFQLKTSEIKIYLFFSKNFESLYTFWGYITSEEKANGDALTEAITTELDDAHREF